MANGDDDDVVVVALMESFDDPFVESSTSLGLIVHFFGFRNAKRGFFGFELCTVGTRVVLFSLFVWFNSYGTSVSGFVPLRWIAILLLMIGG